jgi:hypothetical protein
LDNHVRPHDAADELAEVWRDIDLFARKPAARLVRAWMDRWRAWLKH